MTAVLHHSDFAFADLKNGTATVFLVLPPDRISAYARWLRLMVTQSLQDMARAPGQPPAPVLYLLDEFAALGHLAPVERAMALMAGYGIQLWPILQDLHQLGATYGGRAGTFFSNAAVLQVFGVNDAETGQLVSGLLGQTTIVFSTESRRDGTFLTKGDTSTNDHHTGRPLLTPDEVRNLPQNRELLFVAGCGRCSAKSFGTMRIRNSPDRSIRPRAPPPFAPPKKILGTGRCPLWQCPLRAAAHQLALLPSSTGVTGIHCRLPSAPITASQF